MVPEIAVQALQHAERRNGHTDRDDQVRVHYVDFKGSGNLLKTGHVLEHIDAVIKNKHTKHRERELGKHVTDFHQTREMLFQRIHEHEDAKLFLALHRDGDAKIGCPYKQIPAEFLDPRKRLAEQEPGPPSWVSTAAERVERSPKSMVRPEVEPTETGS